MTPWTQIKKHKALTSKPLPGIFPGRDDRYACGNAHHKHERVCLPRFATFSDSVPQYRYATCQCEGVRDSDGVAMCPRCGQWWADERRITAHEAGALALERVPALELLEAMAGEEARMYFSREEEVNG